MFIFIFRFIIITKIQLAIKARLHQTFKRVNNKMPKYIFFL